MKDPTRENKWMPRFEVPYTVHCVTHNGTSVLCDQQGSLLAGNVTRDMLKPAKVNLGNPLDVFEVETILAHREINGNILYLIRWKEMSSEHDSWEPVENIFDEGCIRHYWSRRGNLPG